MQVAGQQVVRLLVAGHQPQRELGYLGRVNVHETMQGMLWLGRGVFLPIDKSRLLDDVHLLGDVYHIGCRVTSPID